MIGKTDAGDPKVLDWVRRETDRRLREEDPERPSEVAPVECFPNLDEPMFVGPYSSWRRKAEGTPSRAIASMISSYCCGWAVRPDPLEAERAMKGRTVTGRSHAIASMIGTEPETGLVMEAVAEGAFSLQDLAWWLKELAIPAYRRINWLNAFARRRTTPKIDTGRTGCRS